MVRALAAVAKEESASGVREFRVPDKESLTALAESSSGDIRYTACFSVLRRCPSDLTTPHGNLYHTDGFGIKNSNIGPGSQKIGAVMFNPINLSPAPHS